MAANGIISFFFCCVVFHCIRFPWWLSGKESACQTGDWSLIPGLGRSPGEGNGNPFQYSCLRSPMDRGAWQAKSMGLQKNLNRLSGLTAALPCVYATYSFSTHLSMSIRLLPCLGCCESAAVSIERPVSF